VKKGAIQGVPNPGGNKGNITLQTGEEGEIVIGRSRERSMQDVVYDNPYESFMVAGVEGTKEESKAKKK